MVPRPTFTTDIPSIRGIDEVSFEENSGILQTTEQPEHTVAMTRWRGPQFSRLEDELTIAHSKIILCSLNS